MLNLKRLESACLKLDKFLGVILIAVVLCLVFVLAHKGLYDLDIWLHLASGKLILQNKIIPTHDPFSFTVYGKPWVDHSWLFQVISYLVYAHWQANGLVLLQSLVIALTFLVLFIIGYKSINSYFEVAVFLLFTAYASVDRFNIRPDIFSLFFFSIYLYLLRFYPEKKVIWLLLLVQLFWVNIHGYFILGPLLIFFFLTAEYLRRKAKFLPWEWGKESALSDSAYGRLKAVLLFTVLAGLLNPQGVKGALYPLQVFKEVLTGSNKIFFEYIQELAPTFKVYYSLAHYYNIMAIFCFALLLINFKRIRMVELILAVFFFLFGLSIRNSSFFAFVAYIVIVTYVGETLKKLSSKIEFRASRKNILSYVFKCAAQIIFIAFLVSKVNLSLLRNYFDFEKKEVRSALLDTAEDNYPSHATAFLLENQIGPNILNDFNSGAYLIGVAYPRLKVFIDGRTELYGGQFFKEYQQLMEGNLSIFEKMAERYNFDAVLLTTTFALTPPIVAPIYKNPDWKLVYLDPYAIIFLKDIPKNQGLIKRYAIDLSKYTVTPMELKDLGVRFIYPSPYVHLARLFDLLGADEAALQACKEALRIMPNCAEAYHLRGKVYLRKKLYQEALDNLRAAGVLMPFNLEMLTDLGCCLQELKEDKAAADIFKKITRADKKYAPAYYYLGRLELELGNNDGAIGALSRAVQYAPKEAKYHLWLAKAYLAKAKKSKGLSYFDKGRLELERATQRNIEKEEGLARGIGEALREIPEGLTRPK